MRIYSIVKVGSSDKGKPVQSPEKKDDKKDDKKGKSKE